MKIAIIGLGYWGKIILQTVLKIRGFDYLCAVDVNPEKAQDCRRAGIDFYSDIRQALSRIDAAIICTWEPTHYQLAKTCLENGINTLVEKPLTLATHDAQSLVKIASASRLILMVDTTFLFDQSFLKIKKSIKQGKIGHLMRIDSFRFSPNIVKPFTNVIADLFPHDISIFYSLFRKPPTDIKVIGQILKNKRTDNAQIYLKFGRLQTCSFLSWTYPVNKREMTFYGCKGIIYWSKKNPGIDSIKHFVTSSSVPLRLQKEIIIKNKQKTLSKVLAAFFRQIRTQEYPVKSYRHIIQEARILEKALKPCP